MRYHGTVLEGHAIREFVCDVARKPVEPCKGAIGRWCRREADVLAQLCLPVSVCTAQLRLR
jgi:hypothetical protein